MSFPEHPLDPGVEYQGECEECGDDVPNEGDELCGECLRQYHEYENEQLLRSMARTNRKVYE